MAGTRKHPIDPDLLWIGPLILKCRTELGLSQIDLARRVDHHVPRGGAKQYWSIESSKTLPSWATIVSLCRALGPPFVEMLADELYRVSLEPLAEERDQKFAEAQEIHNRLIKPRRPTNTEPVAGTERVSDVG